MGCESTSGQQVKRLLLVEDNPDHILLIRTLFNQVEPATEIEAVTVAEEALERLEKQAYNAVLVDYHLPQGDGLQLLEQIVERGYELPVIMVTGQGDEGVAVRAMKAGAYDYVVKSGDYPGALPRVVRNALEKYRLIVEQKELEEKIIRRNRELSALNLIAAALSGTLELDEMLRGALDAVLEVMEVEAGDVYLLDDKREGFVFKTRRSAASNLGDKQEEISFLDEWARLVVKTGKIQVLDEGHGQPESMREHVKETRLEALVGVPLMAKGMIVGVMNLYTFLRRRFSDGDLQLLVTIGNQIGVAVQNVRLVEEVRRRLGDLNRLYRVGADIVGTLDLDEVLRSIVETAQEVIPTAGKAMIHLLDEETGLLIPRIPCDPEPDRVAKARMFVGEGIAGLVFQEKRSIYVPDTRKEPRYLDLGSNLRSLLVVPLLVGQKVIGTLSADSTELDDFDQENQRMLTMLADQAAIAIENARLYEEARARNAYLETLQRINATLRSILPLSEVLETIVEGPVKALGYIGSLIALPDANNGRLILGAAYGSRRLNASFKLTGHEIEAFALPFEADGNPVVGAFQSGELQAWTGDAEAIIVGVEPSVRTTVARGIQDAVGVKLVVCIPLRVADRTVGVLVVLSPREYLPDDERAMLLGLANQAGLAVENARLYRQVESERDKLAAIMSGLHEGVQLVGPSYVVNFQNRLATQMLGDLVGKSCYEGTLGRTEPCESCPMVRAINTGAMHTAEVCGPGEVEYEVVCVPLRNPDGTVDGIEVIRDITERKRAEEALRESESRYRSLFQESPISQWEEDWSAVKEYLEGLKASGVADLRSHLEQHPDEVVRCARQVKVLGVNKATLDLMEARDKEELVAGMEQILTKESLEVLPEQLIALAEGRRHLRCEALNRTVSGQEKYTLFQQSVPPGYEDSLAKVFITMLDITDLKRAEEETKRRSKELAALNAVASALVGSLDLDGIMNRALDIVLDVMAVEIASIRLLEVETGELTLAAQRGLSEEYVEVRRTLFLDKRGVDKFVASDRSILIEEILKDADALAYGGDGLAKESVRSLAAVRLKSKQNVIGLLTVGSRERRQFTAQEVELLSSIGSDIAMALENASLYQGQRRRLSEMEALRKTTLDITQQLDVPNLLRSLVERAAALVGTKGGGLYLYHDQQQELELVVNLYLDEDYTGTRMKVGEGLSGRVVSTGETLIVEDYSTWEGRSEKFDGAPLRGVLGVPLKWGDRILGVINVTDVEEPRTFTERDVWLLELFANQAAIAVVNARLHEEIKTSEERYRSMVENANDAICLVDLKSGRFVEMNPRMENLTGYSLHELMNMTAEDIHVVQDDTEGELTFRQLLASGVEPFEDTFVVAKDGRLVPVSVSINSIPYSDQKVVEATLRDISTRKRMEEQLIHTEKLAALGRLTASLAHEINNPLQAIQSSIGLLRKRPLDQDRSERYLAIAEREVERLIQLMQRMLDFYRPPKERRGLVDVNAVLKDTLALAHKQLQHGHIRVNSCLAADLPAVHAVASYLKQVFINLILNGVEAMPDGGNLTVSTSVDEERNEVMISLSDTGLGIPAGQLPYVFEPFYTTKETGTGLGLAISYSIVEQHDGTIEVESEEGKGSTFVVRLPLGGEHGA